MKSRELENAVLGCMLIDSECSQDCNLLQNEDICEPINHNILEAIKTLTLKRSHVDLMTVYEELKGVVDISYLSSLNDVVASTRSFKGYVAKLKGHTIKRKIVAMARELQTSDLSGEELSELAEREIFGIREATMKTTDEIDTKRLVMETFGKIEDDYAREGLEGLSTGYRDIDKATNGLKKKNLIYLAGRPAMGKTAFATNIATNVIDNGKSVMIFSLEMAKEELMKRILLSNSRITSDKLVSRSMTKDDWTKLANETESMIRKKITINDNANLTVAEMKSICRREKRKNGLDLIIIDYLQLINPGGKFSSRSEAVDNISKNLKRMAKELEVPIIVIASLNRTGAGRSGNKPLLSDLRESGQIEYDADMVIFVHREEYYEETEENKGLAEIIIAKQRNGMTGIINMAWMSKYTRFVNLDKSVVQNG